jgi:RNase P/RNase MRP subunit p30
MEFDWSNHLRSMNIIIVREVRRLVLKKTVIVTVYSTAENVNECISDQQIRKLIVNVLDVAETRAAINRMGKWQRQVPSSRQRHMK